MTCDATWTRAGMTLRCDRQEHLVLQGLEDVVDMDTDHYDLHLDARWSASCVWDVSTESFVPTLCAYFRLPKPDQEETEK